MSTTRYSGDLTITLTYRERSSDYRATISYKGVRHVVYVGEPRYLQHAVDSPEAFDETAHAAISFASEEDNEIGERAASNRDGSGWHIGRSKKRAWPRSPEESLSERARRPLRVRPLIDDRTYTVEGPKGYRAGPMTFEQARLQADRMREQMKTAGWSGKVRIYYRDGTEVK